MREVFAALGLSLGLTLLFETLFALLFGVRRRDLLLVVLMNLLTNPVVALLNMYLGVTTPLSRWLILLPLEAAAVVVEWLLLRRYAEHVPRPFLLALALNLCSFLTGELLQTIF